APPPPPRGSADDDRDLDAAVALPCEQHVQQRRVPFFLVGNGMALEQPPRQFHHRTDARRDDHESGRIEVLRPGAAEGHDELDGHDTERFQTLLPYLMSRSAEAMIDRSPLKRLARAAAAS